MLPWILAAILAAAVSCVAYGVLIERRWYRLVRRRLNILPTGTRGQLTVLHLSDLHFVRRDAAKAAFLATLPPADVTVVTGDFLAEPEAVEAAVEALRPVRGREASYFVLGANDYFVPRPFNYLRYFVKHRKPRSATRGRSSDLIVQLEADGWEHLCNVRRRERLGGLAVELVGLDDPHIERHDLRVAPRRTPEDFGMAVVHSPDAAPELVALGYDLIMAGHTHGGQIRLPMIGALVTNSDLPPRLVSGLIRFGNTLLHTSRGLGTSKFAPFRFWCRPEATVLELRPVAEASARGEQEAADQDAAGQDAASTSAKTRS